VKPALAPIDAITEVLREHGACTARTVSDLLRTADYQWPARNGYTRPTYERVYSTLRAMERWEDVARIQTPSGDWIWRLTGATTRAAA
jgi:hypothetical protein